MSQLFNRHRSRLVQGSTGPTGKSLDSQLIESKSMSRMLRRASIGILAGAVAGTALLTTLAHPLPILTVAILVGACYSTSLNPTKGTYVDNLMAGGALGIPL